MTLLVRHGTAWLSDPWYGRAWLLWPQLVGLLLILWINTAPDKPAEPPSAAAWVHPIDLKSDVQAMATLRNQAHMNAAAEDLLRARAAGGDKAAEFFMGTLFDPTIERAKASPERTRQALDWYRKSAEQGVASAQANLGNLLSRDNLGLPPNYSEAFTWYERASATTPAAQRGLGLLYRFGKGVPADAMKAMDLIRSAASRGDAIAQRLFAEALDRGSDGLASDPTQAMVFFQRAALQNDVAAEREFAAHLKDGRGIRADQEKAMYWFRRAAAAGDPYAKAQVDAAPKQ